jgi:hypothetical protein
VTEPNTERTANGRFGPGNQAARRLISDATLEKAGEIAKAGAPGTDGFWAPGGFIVYGERDPKLLGRQKWVQYDNLVANVAIVASAVHIWQNLAGSVAWSLIPNKNGGRNATKCVDLVQDGLIDNSGMPKAWRNVVRRQMMKKFRGFSMHSKGWRIDSKGRQVLADLKHLPQFTVERWLQRDEGMPWYAIVQRGRNGKEFDPIKREDIFYTVEDGVSSEADGLGVFRTLVKLAHTLDGLEKLERIGFDGDMRGMPFGRAPLAKLAQEAITYGKIDPKDTDKIKAYIQGQVQFLDDLLKNHMVTRDRSAMLDSAVYIARATDGSFTPTTVPEWSIDTVKTATTAMPELGAAISRVTYHMAMLLNVEHMLLGEGGGGSYAMHGDKTVMMGLAINGSLDDITDDANRDIVRPMCARNGYNPETDAPRLVHEPIPTESIEAVARALMWMYQAPMIPGDKARNVLRDRMDLPPEPDVSALAMAPRAMVPGEPPDPKVKYAPGEGPDQSKAPTSEMKDTPDKLPAAGDQKPGKEGK